MRVGVLAYEGCLAAEIFVFTDLLLIANRVADGAPADPFEVSVIAASRTPVVAAGGFSLGVQEGHHDIDHLVVPGFELVPSEDPATRLSLWDREIEFIRACEARGVRVSSVCVGAYLLGEAGLLDGRRCTTSWLYGADLASRYPGATVRTDSLIVQDDGVTTTAAFTAALDLATALVREHLGDKIARTTARITLAPETEPVKLRTSSTRCCPPNTHSLPTTSEGGWSNGWRNLTTWICCRVLFTSAPEPCFGSSRTRPGNRRAVICSVHGSEKRNGCWNRPTGLSERSWGTSAIRILEPSVACSPTASASARPTTESDSATAAPDRCEASPPENMANRPLL